MEVLPCSGVHYAGECNSPKQVSEKAFVYDGETNCVKHEQVMEANAEVDNMVLNVEACEDEQLGEGDWKLDESPTLEGHPNEDSCPEFEMDGQKLSCTRDSGIDSLDADTVGRELPCGNQECESSFSESKWLEQDQAMAVWVKWRGKWQAGIRCARSDWPLSTLRAKPTHDRKQYLVIFFPRTRNYSWADVLLVRPINEFPEPIAYRSHNIGVKMVKDLTLARRFIMQKLAVTMINTIEQLHSEALIETARNVVVWKDFALEASRCKGYSDLGRMLLKLENMILPRYLNSYWMEHSLQSWVQKCQNAHSAESIEMLKEELGDAIIWNEVHALSTADVQLELGSEWKNWKPEVMKWFSMSNPSFNSGDMEHQRNDSLSNSGLLVSRKRPKLEVRRAEVHAPQLETQGGSNQSLTIEIDSRFFDGQTVNASTLGSGTSKDEASLMPTTEPVDDPSSSTTDKWGEIVVVTGNTQETHFKGVETTPVSKNKQCTAFIEAKGRQCVRWANDGEVYCCVHLASRFSANSAKAEATPHQADTQMCGGTTVLGTKCKHRSLPGSSFCKKHRPHNDIGMTLTYSPENKPKRKQEEGTINRSEANSCKEIVLSGHFETPLQVDTNSNLIQVTEQSGNYDENSCCIGDDVHCHEAPKRHSLYCDKHLPNWLKRARNGKSRIISKEVFIDLLKSCQSKEQKIHLHQACEIFYRFFKSVLSLRNPVPKEIQLQWVISEASKDIRTVNFLMKLVSSEKERIIRLWGFNTDKNEHNSCTVEEPVKVLMANYRDHDDGSIIKCNICSETFSDDQMLGKHWMDNHKKEAQWLFRGYVCAICLDSFTNKKLLEAHVQERHHVQFVEQCMLYQCIPCGSHFGNPDQLWLHVLSNHLANFRLQSVVQPCVDDSSHKSETGNSLQVENVNSDNQGAFRKYICRFCGLKFDLLPDLGRHHQAAHMGSNPNGPRLSKKGVPYYAYRLKSGRLSRPKFKKGLGAASYKIRNRGAGSMKKCIQAPIAEIAEGEPHVPATISLGSLVQSQCSAVAKLLYSKLTKTKPRPDNLEIVTIARFACCKASFQASLDKKYGVLPERLYLKAAKLCSEQNIIVEWHQEGFKCPKGCKPTTDSYQLLPLASLSDGFGRPVTEIGSVSPLTSEWAMDECHYIIDFEHCRQEAAERAIILCDDISFGKESVPVACVVDEHLLGSLNSFADGDEGQTTAFSLPWESFTYVTTPLFDQSLDLGLQSLQLGCGCAHSTCCAKACDHVYLFDNDYEDAKDIYGKTMNGRFPYNEKGQIILEEGYLVYECNNNCSCSKNCQNRVLQNGVRVKLQVFKTEEKGWAVRAGESITRGTFVCEYIGEVVNELEANRRRIRYGVEGCSYIYEIDARVNDMSRLIEGEASYVIDATKYGNVSRYINHSCSPNLESHQVLIESMDAQLSHIGFYASRDIGIGEELTYDYMYKALPGEGCQCLCGASNCRGRLH